MSQLQNLSKEYAEAYKAFLAAASKCNLPKSTWSTQYKAIQRSQRLETTKDLLDIGQEMSDDLVSADPHAYIQHPMLTSHYLHALLFQMWEIGVALENIVAGKKHPLFANVRPLFKEAKNIKYDHRDYSKKAGLKVYLPIDDHPGVKSKDESALLKMAWKKDFGWCLVLSAFKDIPPGTILFKTGGTVNIEKHVPVASTAQQVVSPDVSGLPCPTNIGMRSRLDAGWAHELPPMGNMPVDEQSPTILDTYDIGGLSRYVCFL
jgi:hypothetical protein